MIVAQSHGFEPLQRVQLMSCDSGWERGYFWGAVRGAGMFCRDLRGATRAYVLITVHRAVRFAVGKLFLVCISAPAVINSVNLGVQKDRTDSRFCRPYRGVKAVLPLKALVSSGGCWQSLLCGHIPPISAPGVTPPFPLCVIPPSASLRGRKCFRTH